MRSRNSCPDGANHALNVVAIEVAHVRGTSKLSLCSAPLNIPEQSQTWIEFVLKQVYQWNTNWISLYRLKASLPLVDGLNTLPPVARARCYDPDWN
jgi:lysylphosphatidylglycerol synthetase-like protein (DUF2156 family)